jgi:hypothetical protein
LASSRPGGITALSIIIAFFALSGFGNAALVSSDGGGWTHYTLELISAITYGFSGALASIGLWRMRRWTLAAYSIWALTAIGAIVLFLIDFVPPEARRPIAYLAWPVLLLSLGYWYIRRALNRAAPA